MDIIQQSFQPLLGKPCWNLIYHRQTNLSFNFGKPALRIHEPYTTNSRSKLIQRLAAKRNVHVHGQWRLWIFCAYWRVFEKDRLLGGYSSSFRRGARAADFIDGQKLTAVNVNPANGATVFRFDLGGVLEVHRKIKFNPDADLWMLYKPSGYVLNVHGDGTFDHAPGSGIDKRPGIHKQPLPK